MEIKENMYKFLISLKRSLIPHKYKVLYTNTGNDAFSFFLSVITLSIILMVTVSIPSLYLLHKKLIAESENFEKLEFSFEARQKAPIIIGLRAPQIIIDTSGNYTQLNEGSLLITDKIIDYKILGLKDRIDLTRLGDMTTNEKGVVKTLFYVGLFLLPSILVWLFVAQFVKYMAIIAALGLIGASFSHMMKYEISLKQSLIIAIYSSTAMIILDTLLLPFNLGNLVLQFPIFLNYGISLLTLFVSITIFIIALIMVGSKEYR